MAKHKEIEMLKSRKKIRRVYVTARSLAKVDVELVRDRPDIVLKCKRCGYEWSFYARTDGTLPPNWWHCLRGCHDEKP